MVDMCEAKRFEGVGPNSEGGSMSCFGCDSHIGMALWDRVHCDPDRGMNRGLEYVIGKRFVFSPDYRSDDLIGLIDTSAACGLAATRDGKRAVR
jgi:hypothetical protein